MTDYPYVRAVAGHTAVHYGNELAVECGAELPFRYSHRPEDITCRTCRGWLPIVVPETLDCTKLIEREGWDCAKCGHRHAGRTLANICVGCACPETTPPDTAEDDWIRIATQNSKDATARLKARIASITEAFAVLRATLVPFNERKQEFFCTVCRYRDPLGPDGNKLHDDNCPLLAVLNVLARDEAQSVRAGTD